MARKINPGELHWLKVAFEDNPHRAKIRPVLILDVEEDKIYYYRITTNKGKYNQLKYRPSLEDWRRSGLKKQSYILLNNPPQIAYDSDFEVNSFIGNISQDDADRMSEFMRNLGY